MAERPRIGNCGRPDREWEIWNDNYCRDTGGFVQGDDLWSDPWIAWHPDTESYPSERFKTHAEAIAWVHKQIPQRR